MPITPANLVMPGEFPPLPTLPQPEAIQPGAGSDSPLPMGEGLGVRAEFSSVLGQELERVNNLLAEADLQAQRVAIGEADNLHEAMLAMAQADLALQVTMRVTQKAISAYQEISRMQI